MKLAALTGLALLVSAVTLRAQVPAEFKNLQELPKDISRAELVARMRAIAGDLGVRCTYCHVGPDNLQGMDFATDDKRTKQLPRTMMKKTRAINTDYVGIVPAGSEPRQTVTCVTCHRRSPKPPRHLPALLYETLTAGGTQAAIEQHRKLREEFLDSGLYDFRESTLNILATRLRDERRFAEALDILKRNIELFPDRKSVV